MATVITETDDFDATVSAPDDLDILNAASVTNTGVGFQALANRTNNLVRRVGGVSGSAEHLYRDATGALTPKSRVRIISPHQLDTHAAQIATGSMSWYAGGGQTLTSIADNARLAIDLNQILPNGAIVTQIRAVIAPGAARTAQTSVPGDNGRMWSRLLRGTPDFATPAATSFGSDIGAIEDAGGTGVQLLTNASLSETINKSATYLLWQLIAGNDAGTNRDDVEAIEISYTDPGPQNF